MSEQAPWREIVDRMTDTSDRVTKGRGGYTWALIRRVTVTLDCWHTRTFGTPYQVPKKRMRCRECAKLTEGKQVDP